MDIRGIRALKNIRLISRFLSGRGFVSVVHELEGSWGQTMTENANERRFRLCGRVPLLLVRHDAMKCVNASGHLARRVQHTHCGIVDQGNE